MSEKSGKITESTLVPLGLLATIVTVFVTATWAASSFNGRLVSVEKDNQSLKDTEAAIVKELQTVNLTLVEIKTTLKKGK